MAESLPVTRMDLEWFRLNYPDGERVSKQLVDDGTFVIVEKIGKCDYGRIENKT